MSSILDLEYADLAPRRLTLVPQLPTEQFPTRPAGTGFRLTRRGRLVILVGAVLTLIVLAITLGSTTAATDEVGTPVPSTTVTVMPGQTLWDLAGEVNPRGQDVRTTVADIMRLNSLETAGELQSGDQIAVPIYR